MLSYYDSYYDFLEDTENRFQQPSYQYDEDDYEFTADTECCYRIFDREILRTLY